MHKRIIAIAAAFGAERQAAMLYARNSHFRNLCDDLQEVIELSDALPPAAEHASVAAEYDQLIAQLIGELRDYLRDADEWLARSDRK